MEFRRGAQPLALVSSLASRLARILLRVLCRTVGIEAEVGSGKELARLLVHRGPSLLLCDGMR